MEILEFLTVEDKERARTLLSRKEEPFRTFVSTKQHPELEKLCMASLPQAISIDLENIPYFTVKPEELKQRNPRAYAVYQHMIAFENNPDKPN